MSYDASRMPRRITLSRKKGFRLQELSRSLNGLPAVKVTRPGPWGNPYQVSAALSSETAVDLFRVWARTNPDFRTRVRAALIGKNLACWCKPGQPCHADVLLKIANR